MIRDVARCSGALATLLLGLASPTFAGVVELAAFGGEHKALAGSPADDSAIAQFTSGGHVLGFSGNGYFVSNGTYGLRVSFEGAETTSPSFDNVGQGKAGAHLKPAPLSRVSYSEVWPGIGVTYDVAYGGIASSTWTLAPRANPALVRLRYNRSPEITTSGELKLSFETGAMIESRPVAWQDIEGHRTPVQVEFEQLGDDVVGFRIGRYSRELPLIIDPTIVWTSGSAGSGGYSAGIAIDASGNVYVSGGYADASVVKFSASGAVLWRTSFGGVADDFCHSIAVDAGGNVYVAGESRSPWGNPIRAYGSGTNLFVAKLSPSGALVWNTFLDRIYDHGTSGIAVNDSGDVYVTGSSTISWGNPLTAYGGGGTDAFLAKLSSSGAVLWNTFRGLPDQGNGASVAVDGGGNVYWTGFRYNGNRYGFVIKSSSLGAVLWTKELLVNGYFTGITLDSTGTIYLAGYSTANWGNPVRAFSGGQLDVFAAKLSSSGSLIWSTFLGGLGIDRPGHNNVAVESNGNVWVVGTSDEAWGNPEVSYSYLYDDAFAAKLSSTGTLLWNSFFDSPAYGSGVKVDSSAAYMGGGGVALKLAYTTCGDGLIEGSETCDDGNSKNGDCCSSICGFETPTVKCRLSSGVCDSPEYCSGSSGACPPNTLVVAGAVCRGAAGVCDLVETCTGSSIDCPADLKSTAVCRASAGICDVAESCNATSAGCPANSLQGASTVCRASVGPCDLTEVCNGASGACPGNAFAVVGTVCRASAGICDVAETCSGAAAPCPSDIFKSSTVACRGSVGICDIAEKCTGSSLFCPVDAKSTTVCRAAGGVCDVAENCNGSSDSCPDDVKSTAVCRDSAGVCDVAENCDGSANLCPANVLASTETICRAASDVCDVSESCSGTSAVCPADLTAGTLVVCRPSNGVCDLVERCNGSTKICPNDAKSTGTCRLATGGCDASESCNGASDNCPVDASRSSGVVCRFAAGVCDVAEICSGLSTECPADIFASDLAICRSSEQACDLAESCTGASSICPPDAHASNGSPCNDQSDCTENDVCTSAVCAGTVDPSCGTTTTTLPAILCGDANGDGNVAASDALEVLRVAVGIGTCPVDACDFNGDGNITTADALAILRVAVGQQVTPKCPVADGLLQDEPGNMTTTTTATSTTTLGM